MTTQILEDELLTPDQVSEMLSIPKATLYKWRASNTGPAAFRIGKHLRYRASVVAEWVALQENQ